MTEGELRAILREHGWVLELRARRATGKRYAYARRREGQKVITRYLFPEDQMSQAERQMVEQKLS